MLLASVVKMVLLFEINIYHLLKRIKNIFNIFLVTIFQPRWQWKARKCENVAGVAWQRRPAGSRCRAYGSRFCIEDLQRTAGIAGQKNKSMVNVS